MSNEFFEVGKEYTFLPKNFKESKTKERFGWVSDMNFVLDHKPHKCTFISFFSDSLVVFEGSEGWDWAREDFEEVLD